MYEYILNRRFRVNVLDPVGKPQGPMQLADVGVRDSSDGRTNVKWKVS
jgi:hypothetical protein